MTLEAMQLTDEQLVAGMREGRAEALLTLYDRHAPLAVALARRVTADPGITENVVAEAFLMAWRGADGYTAASGSVRTWLLGIVEERAAFRAPVGAPGAGALPPFDDLVPDEPPPSLRTRVGATATGDLATGRHPSATATLRVGRLKEGRDITGLGVPAPGVPPAPARAVTRDGLPVPRRGPRWFIGIVGAILIFVLGVSAILVRQDLAAAQAYAAGVDAALELATQPGSVSATLIPAAGGGISGLAVIGSGGEIRLVVRGLEPTRGFDVYAAWLEGADGSYARIAEFPAAGDGTAVAAGAGATAAAGQVVLVTLERAAGATSPAEPPVASGITVAVPSGGG